MKLAPTDDSSPLGPPSAPGNLSFSVSGTQLSLRWEPPTDMGGRQDVQYSVECLQCRGTAQDGGPCQPCGTGVHLSPGARELTTPSVKVEGLEPNANYTFNIKSQNGVSRLSSSSPASASLRINMGQAGRHSVQAKVWKPQGPEVDRKWLNCCLTHSLLLPYPFPSL